MELALVYMVAGLSNRFGGKIKQFAIVGKKGETLIEYSLKQALPAGFTKIIFIVSEKTQLPFKEIFGNNYQGIPVQYALQLFNQQERDKPWGTVDALCAASHLIKEPFVVCNGDDLYGEQAFEILATHLKNHAEKNAQENATLGYILKQVFPEHGKVNRGIFTVENNYVIDLKEVFDIEKNNLEEKNVDENSLASMNIFALLSETIHKLKLLLEGFKMRNKNNRTIECLLPEQLSALIKNKEITMRIYPTTAQWFGITNPGDEEKIRKALAER